jgi:hypothetical protein
MADYDPTQIDVSLSLLSGADSKAAQDLAKQLTTVAKTFEAIHDNFDSYGKKLEKIAESLSKLTESGTSGGASTPPNAVPVSAPPTTQQAMKATAMAGKTYEQADSGLLVPPGASTPPPPSVEEEQSRANWISRAYQRGQQSKNPLVRSASDFAATTFGEWARRSLDPEALQRVSDSDKPLRTFSKEGAESLIANIPHYLAQYAVFHGVGLEGLKDPLNLSMYSNQATQLGYGRGGQVTGPFGLGATIPGLKYFDNSAAGRQAKMMKETELAMRWQSGINHAQAVEINNQIAESGFSGEMANHVAMGVMAPVFRQTGMAPQVMAEFLGAIRTGTASFHNVREELEGLAPAARAAQMNLDQFAQQAAAVGEANQSMGGTFRGGVTKATDFSLATGLPPDRAAQLMQNPFVQGMMLSQSGLPPQISGALGPSAFSNSVYSAADLAYGMYRKSFRDTRTPIKDVHGNVVGYETLTGDRQARAMAAQTLGMDLEEFDKLRRNERQSKAASSLLGATNAWAHQKGSGISWGEITGMMHDAGISQRDITRISHMSTAGREKAIQDALGKTKQAQNQQHSNAVEIKLDGPAANLFKLVDKNGGKAGKSIWKEMSNAGGAALQEMTNGPIGPMGLPNAGALLKTLIP